MDIETDAYITIDITMIFHAYWISVYPCIISFVCYTIPVIKKRVATFISVSVTGKFFSHFSFQVSKKYGNICNKVFYGFLCLCKWSKVWLMVCFMRDFWWFCNITCPITWEPECGQQMAAPIICSLQRFYAQFTIYGPDGNVYNPKLAWFIAKGYGWLLNVSISHAYFS